MGRTKEEVVRVLKAVTNKEVLRPDDVSAEVLKHSLHE